MFEILLVFFYFLDIMCDNNAYQNHLKKTF
jgi:hypothetical protein